MLKENYTKVPTQEPTDEHMALAVASQPEVKQELLPPEEISHRAYLKEISRVFFPAMIFNAFGLVTTFGNNAMLSKINDPNILEKADLISTWDTTVIMTSTTIFMAAGASMSDEGGAADNEQIDKAELGESLRSSCVIALGASIPFIMVQQFMGDILKMGGVTPEYADAAQDYFRVASIGTPISMLGAAARQFVIAAKQNKLTLPPAILNLILTFGLGTVLISGVGKVPGYGIMGMSYTRMVTASLPVLIYFKFLKNLEFADYRIFVLSLSWKKIKAIGKESVKIAGSTLIELLPLIIMSMWVGRYTDEHNDAPDLAAQNIALQYNMLSYIPIFSAQQTANNVVARYKGANLFDHARRFGYRTLTYSTGFSIIVAGFFIAFRDAFAKSFIKDDTDDRQDVLNLSSKLMIITGFTQVIDNVRVVTTGKLQAYKKNTYVLVNSLITIGIIGLIISNQLCFKADWGAQGIAMGHFIAVLISALSLQAKWYFTSKAPSTISAEERQLLVVARSAATAGSLNAIGSEDDGRAFQGLMPPPHPKSSQYIQEPGVLIEEREPTKSSCVIL